MRYLPFLKTAFVAAVMWCVGVPAQAVSVTLSSPTFSFTFDDTQYADTAVNAPTALSDIANIDNIVDGDLNTLGSVGPNDIGQIGFTDNVLGNGDGYDLLILEGGAAAEPMSISLTEGGTAIPATLLGAATNILAGGRNPWVYAIDLTDLGVGPGVALTSDIFVMNFAGSTTDIEELVALNVPEPTSLMLFTATCGCLGLHGSAEGIATPSAVCVTHQTAHVHTDERDTQRHRQDGLIY